MRLARYLYRLRTEGGGPGRQAAAVGLGVFIGCTPFYGAHLWMCIAAGWLLRLNRLKMYLAANVSNPFLAPLIVFSEIQAGSWVRRGVAYPLTVDALRRLDPWTFAADLLIGSALVGGALGAVAGLVTWAMRGTRLDREVEDLIGDAAASYLDVGISAWELANGKLRLDPLYREAYRRIAWPDDGRILDLGCGRGLMLSVAAAHYRRRPGAAAGVALCGFEYRPRMVRLARRALGDAAVVEQADLAMSPLPACAVAMLFDVLHCLPEGAQESLLTRVRDSVEPGGLLAIREADAGGGWRFAAGQACNRTVALCQGRWRRRFHFRTAAEWAALLGRHGFTLQDGPVRQSGLFANVLMVARRECRAGL